MASSSVFISFAEPKTDIKDAKIDAKLILQVHDELIVEANKNCAHIAKEILKREMENAVKMAVKLKVEAHYGKNWLEAKG